MKPAERVTISWPDPGLVDGAFCTSLITLFNSRRNRLDGVLRVEGGLLSRQRNEIVNHFLTSSRAAWLLMIDSDEQLPVESFDKLIAAADADKRPVMAGLYFGTWPGDLIPTPVPHIYRRHPDGLSVSPVLDYPTDEVIEIDAAGTGAILVHRRVLEAMRDAADVANEGREWCWFRDLPIGGKWLGEDLYFCRRIRSLGFPIYAHTGAILKHHRRYWLDNRQHEAARYYATKEAS